MYAIRSYYDIRELRSILVRALFFRQGTGIDAEDIREAIGAPLPPPAAEPAEQLTRQVAGELLERIEAGEDFWQAVYTPYSGIV